MYAIAGRSTDGETTYWVGGEVFSVQREDAACYIKEVDAEATIIVLTRAWPQLADPLFVIELPDPVRD